jgi:hypothetical protein
MDEKTIGKAHCQATLLLDAYGEPMIAGVVRIGNENKIVLVEVSGDEIIRIMPPDDRPDELDSNPAFSCWKMASMAEANQVIKGIRQTRRHVSLGYPGDLLGMC